MPRRDEALAAMRDALQIQDPEWDIVPGTAEYKILEAVAQQIENITFNSVLNDYHFDVDKKTGLELDLFMSLFGFARIKGRRATGSITFSRGSTATQDYVIPIGTQIFVPPTDYSPSIFFQTTISAVLPLGSTEVSVPAQAVVAGTTGNVGSATITGLATSIGGITAVTNVQPFSGGRDAESDTDLKDRWRRTVFRNISGTEDAFLATAFNESAYVTRANLIGPIERYSEQIQLSAPEDLTTANPWQGTLDAGDPLTDTETDVSLTAGHGVRFSTAATADPDTHFYIGFFTAGEFTEIAKVTNRVAGSDTMTVERAASADSDNITHAGGITIRQVFPSSVPDSKYTFPQGGEIVGTNVGVTTQQLGTPSSDAGTTGDYMLLTTTANGTDAIPAGSSLPFLYVTLSGATTFGLDSVIDVEHEYTPLASRNDLPTVSADKVDLFVDGEDPLTVIEQFPFPAHGDIDIGTDVAIADFLRDDGITPPQDGNLYTRLSKGPITAVPDSITVAATNTQAATTYVKDEDYWLITDQTEVEGSPRSNNGIEWKQPSTAPADAFSATVQVVAGNLAGWYSYIYTYENDGVETLAGTDTPETPSAANVAATDGKNALVIPVNGSPGAVTWRKIYRTTGQATQAAALAATHYLLAVVKNNVTTAYLDNKPDTALGVLQPPKAEPEAGTLVSVQYNYNRLIERLDAQVELVRLVGMDTLVHAADDVSLKFNLAVVLTSGMNATDVEADVNTILNSWINRKSFRNNIQIADVIEEVGRSSGIDNVRLVRAGEERNEVQKVAVTTTAASPLASRDTFKITIDGYTTGAIAYNETNGTVREILEALPNINEGNTYATVVQDAGGISSSDTTLTVTDSAGIHEGGLSANPILDEYYLQIENEVVYVTAAVDNGATADLTIKRAQLNTTAAAHADGTAVHILGDVGVSKATSGATTTFSIYFLPNGYSQVNDWGARGLDTITAAAFNDAALVTTAVTTSAQGVGSGVQQIAANGSTIVTTYYDDFYLDSDELPSLFGVDLLLRAQNTF